MMMVFRGKKIIYLFNELFPKAFLFVEAIFCASLSHGLVRNLYHGLYFLVFIRNTIISYYKSYSMHLGYHGNGIFKDDLMFSSLIISLTIFLEKYSHYGINSATIKFCHS